MALVSSASRRVRKIGQVRVLGFSSARSLPRKRDVPLLVLQVLHVVGEEDEIGRRRLHLRAAEDQDAELERPMNVGKERRLVLEVVEADQRLATPSSSPKNSLVVWSVAMPEGTSSPTRPRGATIRRASSAKTM